MHKYLNRASWEPIAYTSVLEGGYSRERDGTSKERKQGFYTVIHLIEFLLEKIEVFIVLQHLESPEAKWFWPNIHSFLK